MRNILLLLVVALLVAGAYFFGVSGSNGNLLSSDAKKADAAVETTVAQPAEVTAEDEKVDFEAEYVPFDIKAYNASQAAKRWAIYLEDDIPALDFIDYDVLVFDSYKHPKLRALEHQNKALLARMNFFFLENHENFYTDQEKREVLFTAEKDGRTMAFVDIRSTEWLRIMIEKKIPHLTNMGFNGLLLEGVDDAVMLERTNPDKYFGMIEALGRFIRTVKQHFPYLKIMLKDSMHVTSVARQHVDMILFVQSGDEGLLSKDKQSETYKWAEGVRQTTPRVELYSLDFIDIANTSKDEIKALYAERRKNGLVPYVAQEDLGRHYVEPF